MAHSASGFWRRGNGITGKALVAGALLLPTPSWALFRDELEVFASENVTYDSNVLRLSRDVPAGAAGADRRSDWTSTTGVGFNLNLPVSLQRFELGYTWYAARYDRFKDLDHDGHSGRAVWNWAVTPRITGDLGYQEQRGLASFANIQGRRPDLVTSRMAFASGAWMAAASWRAHAALGAARIEHDDPLRRINDLETETAEVGLSYINAQENRVGVAVRGEQGRNPEEVPLLGVPFNNKYDQYGAGVQFRWVVTGLSRFDGRVDWTRRSYEQFSARDYSGPITELLLINESRARANSLFAALGTRMEFEPRRRGDAQFVFVGAQPVQGRSLRPGLKFHLSEDLPIYATSDIFEPDTQANNDLEGVIFPDMPWVISPDAASTQLRSALTRHWPVRARGRGRLYAFGFDACRIVPLLKAGQFGSAHAISGMTGLLSIDEKGHVKRELDWAKVSGGRALPLGTAATASAR